MSEANKRILLAEADPAARILLRRRLEAEGYAVAVAEDGAAALAMAAEALPDLLVVDVSLPKVDGIQVIRRLRAADTGGLLPILVISAYARDLVDRGLAGVRGPDGFFPKPIDFRELQARIRALMEPAHAMYGGSGSGAPHAGVVVFVGAKGGVGTTTIATNVSVTLARQQQPTVLFETAIFHGTLRTLSGLVGTGSVDQLSLDDPARLTVAVLERALTAHPSGLRVLVGSAGGRPDPPEEGVVALTNALRSLATRVVVDLDSAVDVYGRMVLQAAERIWLVTQPESAGVERSGALVRLLEDRGIDPRSIGLLVNQTSSEMMLEPAEIGQRVGRSVGCWIPFAGSSAFEAGRRGLPLVDFARDHPASSALSALAGSLSGRQAVAAR